MHTSSILPSSELLHLIREVRYSKYSSGGQGEHQSVIIDDGCYDFVFYKGITPRLSYGNGNVIEIDFNIFTIHGLSPPYKFSMDQDVELFVIKVQPWANAQFFPPQLSPGVLDLTAIYSHEISLLYKELFPSKESNKNVKLFEHFIKSLNIYEHNDMFFVKNICERIYESEGIIKVNDLVSYFGRSRQYINKKFKQQVNYTTKQFIMIVRILSLVKYKIVNPDISLTSTAHHFHYSDQAHFNNDFKKVCGVAPTVFFKNLPLFFHRHKK